MPDQIAAERGAWIIRNHTLRWGARTYVMGILNVTPDSFSGDGLQAAASNDPTGQAVAQAQAFAVAGADILDVGGESTRPGAQPVAAADEIVRVVPVIAALRHTLDLPISVDTWKAEVAAAALDAGADIVNSIWGVRAPNGGWNTELIDLVRARNVPIVIMHNRRAQASVGAIGGHYQHVEYANVAADVIGELRASAAFALERGIRGDQIMLDPGVGFGKTPAQNIELLRDLHLFRALPYPLLLGTSRKSFIGLALGGVPPQERVEGSLATAVLGVAAGVDVVRVHDVAATVRAIRVTDAVVRPGAWQRLTAT